MASHGSEGGQSQQSQEPPRWTLRRMFVGRKRAPNSQANLCATPEISCASCCFSLFCCCCFSPSPPAAENQHGEFTISPSKKPITYNHDGELTMLNTNNDGKWWFSMVNDGKKCHAAICLVSNGDFPVLGQRWESQPTHVLLFAHMWSAHCSCGRKPSLSFCLRTVNARLLVITSVY